MLRADWEEGIALGFLREVGEPATVDAFELAEAAGFAIRYGGKPRRTEDTIWLPRKASPEQQQWFTAHELGHWLLDRANELQSEAAADFIACALLAPRYALRQFAERGATLDEVAAAFPCCQRDVLAARYEALTASVA